MDLKSPAKLSKNTYIFIGIGFFVVLIIVIIYLIFDTNNTKDNKENNLNPGFKNIIDSITTDDSFFQSFIKEPKEKKVIERKPKQEPLEEAKQNTKKEVKDDFSFNEVFNKNNSKKIIRHITTSQYLSLANKSTQVKTFKKFDKKLNIEKSKDVNTHYKSSNIKASYPVDFSRVLTADRNINAILVNDINSTLQGKVIAQVEDNIYAAHGRNILIPVGSKAIGYYKPLNQVGDTRLQIIWSRIITPKGVNIAINSELADQMGRSGLAGEVDTRFFDRYGMALLISTISALAQTQANNNSNQAVFINTYGKELTNISAKILEEQINIKPIITINAGARILISPMQDIWFRNIDGEVVVQAFNFNKER